MQDRAGVYLADSGFGEGKYFPYLSPGHFFVVIKTGDNRLSFRQESDSIGEDRFSLVGYKLIQRIHRVRILNRYLIGA